MAVEVGRLHRRSVRLKGFDYTRAGAYFITMVTQDRLPLFGEIVGGEICLSPLGTVARQQWERLPRRFPHVGLDEFVVMPNHVHGIIVIYDDILDIPDPRTGTAVFPDATDLSDSRRGTADKLINYGLQSSRRAPTTDSPVLQSSLPAPTDSQTLEQFGQPVAGSIPTMIRSYKSSVAYRINLIRRTPAAAVWQRNYYEHIIRDDPECNRIAHYIIENPSQWETDDENSEKCNRSKSANIGG